MRNCPPVHQSAVVNADIVGGVLHRAGQGVPVNHALRKVTGGRQRGLKIIDFKISIQRQRRRFAARCTTERGKAMNREGYTLRAIRRLYQRPYLSEVVARSVEF